jgi:hypothetical protein
MAIYEYRAKCVRVVDGGTVDLDVDLGFNMRVVQRFRLQGFAPFEGKAEGVLRQLLFIASVPVPLLIHTSASDEQMVGCDWYAKVMLLEDTLPLVPGGSTYKQWIDITNILIYKELGEAA